MIHIAWMDASAGLRPSCTSLMLPDTWRVTVSFVRILNCLIHLLPGERVLGDLNT